MKKINLIWCHPRQQSLTATVVDDLIKKSHDLGFEVNEVDLYRSGFSPVLGPEDEPDFGRSTHDYSPVVNAFAESLSAEIPVVIVFPVWWYALPAMLKGYLDRVWNYGIAYGENSSPPASRILWLGLIGSSEKAIRKRGFDQAIEKILNEGVAGYCGVKNSTVTLLYDTLAEEVENADAHYQNLLEKAGMAFESFIESP